MALPLSCCAPAVFSSAVSFLSSAPVLPSEGVDLVAQDAVRVVQPAVLLAAGLDEVGQLQQGGVRADVGALGRVETGEEDEPREGEDGHREDPHGTETADTGRTGTRPGGVGRIAQRTLISFGAAEALR
jgi:hypothetical protein